MNINRRIILLCLLVPVVGCSDSETRTEAAAENPALESRLVIYTENRVRCADFEPLRKPLFGDLHVHTSLSFDAAANRINTMPEHAYRYAMGKAIPFFPQGKDGKPTGTVQIDRPLDFLAVTDHSEFLGEQELCRNSILSEYSSDFCTAYRKDELQGTLMLTTVIWQKNPRRIDTLCQNDGKRCEDYAREPWQRVIKAAEDAYDRTEHCTFTTFVGYEYTGTPGHSNYHRNIIFRNSLVPELPVSYVEAPTDIMLWEQLDRQCNTDNGCDYLTIPHNSNLSNGLLLTPYANLEPTSANKRRYAQARLDREPLMEIFQHKGASECINGLNSVLGAVDELCDIEQVRIFGEISKGEDYRLKGAELVLQPLMSELVEDCGDDSGSLGIYGGGCVSRNDFLRSALLTGLEQEQRIGLNPVKLGVVASTDNHTGIPGNVAEDNWHGAVGGELTTQQRLMPGRLPTGSRGNPGGLAGVWAVENSRDAIFEAMVRRETFGTSGPRITPRFFGGWNYAKDSCDLPNMIEQGYAKGVPMGGDMPPLPASRRKPTFIAAANRDPIDTATPLQKLQVIKGWIDDAGKAHTQVYTIAGSPNNNAGVDVTTGRRFGAGHNGLCAVFEDTDFEPSQPAFYYLRAVENPSPRWSLLDCLSLPEPERPEVCSDPAKQVIQEMAWSSPIWYTPNQ
ncbi:MAG: DUF3604 domain-containing protein [Pseudomonadales bacterium]